MLPILCWLVARGGFYSAGLMAFAAAASTIEYYTITLKKLDWVAWLGVFSAATLPLYPTLNAHHGTAYAFWTTALFFLSAWAFHLLGGPHSESPSRVGHLVTGLLYSGIGFHSFSNLRVHEDGLNWVLCALIITWGNDTAAYFAGRFFGKHKLYPEISPNKTWEGFAGGLLGSVGGLFIFKQWFFPVLTNVDCLALGILGGIVGPIGDLCESMIKRAHQVKDSGRMIPGHGGMLDRVDALLFNGPLVFLYVYFLKSVTPPQWP